ncbi:hypothetical protein ABPG77_006739 [Micractinium sp. CCAP 211/92]
MRPPLRPDDPRSAAALAQQLRTARRQLHLAFFAACALLAWLLVQPGDAPSKAHRVIARRGSTAGAAVAAAADSGILASKHSASLADAWDAWAVAAAAGDASASTGAGVAGAAGQGAAPKAAPQQGAALPAAEGSQAGQQHGGAGGGSGSGGAALPAGDNASWPFPTTGDTIHVFITSNGKPYVNWQTLVLYGTFLRAQRMPGGDKMVAFTRILHRVTDDALVPGVPTWRVDPVRPECGGGGPAGKQCKYVIVERPSAVRKFLAAARQQPSLIQAPWLYLIETDFVFIKPIQAPGPAESAVTSLAFLYNYISPKAPGLKDVLRRLYPPGLGPLGSIPRTGPSPVLARIAEWFKLVDRWEGASQQIEGDAEAVEKLGWVREMYAFSIAAAVERVPLAVAGTPSSPLIAQLPADDSLGAAHAFHYTWGPRVFWISNHSLVWKFEKRDLTAEHVEREASPGGWHGGLGLPKVPMPPPFQPDVWTRRWERNPNAGPFTRQLHEAIVQMVTAINAGINEVGGASWKEVLGTRAAQRGQDGGGTGAGDAAAKAVGALQGPASSAAGTVAGAGAAVAGLMGAAGGVTADGAGATAAAAPVAAALESSSVGGSEAGSIDMLS